MLNSAADEGVVIVTFGPQPIKFVTAVCKIAGPHAVACGSSAKELGASTVIGSRTAIDHLMTKLAPELPENPSCGAHRTADAEQGSGLSSPGVNWLASGERGAAANTVFTYLTGIYTSKSEAHSHPYDPSDWRRCQLLIETVPEVAQGFEKMAALSEEWRMLVQAWPLILEKMESEVPEWRDRSQACTAHESLRMIRNAIGRGHLNS